MLTYAKGIASALGLGGIGVLAAVDQLCTAWPMIVSGLAAAGVVLVPNKPTAAK